MRCIWDILSFILHLAVIIIHESGVGISVGCCQSNIPPWFAGKRNLPSETPRFAGVSHDSSGGGAIGEGSHLLIATFYKEEGEISRELTVECGKM